MPAAATRASSHGQREPIQTSNGRHDHESSRLSRPRPSSKDEGVHCAHKNLEWHGATGIRDYAGRDWKFVPAALVATFALLAVVAAGCGGSSSKPAYCSDKTTLQSDVNALKSSLSSGDVSSLSSQVSTIKTDATTLVSSGKSDFPSQTSAIKASVDTLTTAVNALPSNPSTSQIAALAVDAASVLSSVNSFSDAASSTCS